VPIKPQIRSNKREAAVVIRESWLAELPFLTISASRLSYLLLRFLLSSFFLLLFGVLLFGLYRGFGATTRVFPRDRLGGFDTAFGLGFEIGLFTTGALRGGLRKEGFGAPSRRFVGDGVGGFNTAFGPRFEGGLDTLGGLAPGGATTGGLETLEPGRAFLRGAVLTAGRGCLSAGEGLGRREPTRGFAGAWVRAAGLGREYTTQGFRGRAFRTLIFFLPACDRVKVLLISVIFACSRWSAAVFPCTW
jgi:hypothetical protein